MECSKAIPFLNKPLQICLAVARCLSSCINGMLKLDISLYRAIYWCELRQTRGTRACGGVASTDFRDLRLAHVQQTLQYWG